MKPTIQLKFFAWLTLHTFLIFIGQAAIVRTFNIKEINEYKADPEAHFAENYVESENRESLMIMAGMALVLPAGLAVAWLLSRRILKPWQELIDQARSISDGHLDQRINVQCPTDEIGQLADALNSAFDRYQHLLDHNQRFSFDASHQLRNPLAAMRTNGEICLKRDRTPEEYKTTISEILEDTGRLSRTVEQLLMLARAAGSPLEDRVTTQIQPLIDEVVREGQVVGELRNIRIKPIIPERPIRIQGMPELLHAALSNLMDNALRFTPENGTIVLKVTEHSKEAIRIAVIDNGPGLSEALRDTVFQPYHRRPGKDKESVGLGLAIVEDICAAHEGSCGVESNPGGGSLFWIELPRGHS